MSRILASNGNPIDQQPQIARPGELNLGVDFKAHPQGVLFTLVIQGNTIGPLPLSADMADQIGLWAIRAAHQSRLMAQAAGPALAVPAIPANPEFDDLFTEAQANVHGNGNGNGNGSGHPDGGGVPGAEDGGDTGGGRDIA